MPVFFIVCKETYVRERGYEQVGHGIYYAPDSWIDEAYILTLRCSCAVFSHDEALYYHGLIDREPIHQTITVYTGYGTARLVESGIQVFTVKKELLDVGKIIIKNSMGHDIPIYNLERTICDLFRNRKYFEIQDFQKAIKSYIARKDKNLNQLMEYGKLFHVEKKIREYMEVML